MWSLYAILMTELGERDRSPVQYSQQNDRRPESSAIQFHDSSYKYIRANLDIVLRIIGFV